MRLNLSEALQSLKAENRSVELLNYTDMITNNFISNVTEEVKVVHMIALGNEFYEKINWTMLVSVISAMNPTYRITIWRELDVVRFISENYTSYMLLYEKLSYISWKSDLARYLILYSYGGIYLDVDMLPFMGFDEMKSSIGHPSQIFVIGGRKRKPYQGCNGFIVTTKKNPLFLTLIDHMGADVATSREHTLHVTRFYKVLDHIYGGIGDFRRIRDTYFFRERWVGPDWRWAIYMNNTNQILLSNGNKDKWPPFFNNSQNHTNHSWPKFRSNILK